jgi:3-oxocholest-4-en-26-oate---CoA ligase
MEFNLADLFEAVADAVPDRIALIAGDRRLTYRDLDERANRVAQYLRDVGVRPGQHVGIYSFNRVEWAEAMIGCYKARAVPINVNYRYVVDELRYLFDNADLVGLVFEAEFGPHVAAVLPGLPKLKHLVQLDDGTGTVTPGLDAVDYEEALASAAPTRDGLRPRSPDDLYILYTGGTTGMPKGVMWRAEDIFFAAMGGGNYGGPGIESPTDLVGNISATPGVTFALAPLMHGNAQWSMFVGLFGGNTVTLNASRRFDADEIWDLVERDGVNVLSLVGDAMARPLVDALAHRNAPPALFAVVSGGAILSPAIKQELNERAPNVAVIDAFGASETGANGAVDVTDKGPRFLMNESTTVITEDGEVAPVGEVGLLARRGHVPVGYYKDEAKTAATFTVLNGVRWAIPGDRAVIEEDGKINVLGRGSQCINTGGEKVFPEEVEAVLKSHPDVFDAIVVGVPDSRWGETVAAVVAPRAGRTITLEMIGEYCRSALAGYKVPRRLIVVDTVERTPAGKPNYRWAKETATAASA